MSDAHRGRDRDRRRGGRRRRRGQRRPPPPPLRTEPLPQPDCPVCQKPIRDIYAAISYSLNDQPAHFDCVLGLLASQEEVAGDERLCYLGAGSFGVVSTTGGRRKELQVRKRIQYEPAESIPDWRKQLRA